MSENRGPEYQHLLQAISFAARSHRHQLRKDQQTPYASHPFRVCLTLRMVFGIDDVDVLTAAVLHDTIEDTTTDFDDLAEAFGTKIAEWVSVLTKDKRLPDTEREEAYAEGLMAAGWQVQVCKLADIYDNLSDVNGLNEERRQRTLRRSKHYLDKLAMNLRPEARTAWQIVRTMTESSPVQAIRECSGQSAP